MLGCKKHESSSEEAVLRALKIYRSEAGLTGTALAELSGVPRTTISKIEHGRLEPSAPTLKKLADALGVTVADMMLMEEKFAYPKAEAPSSRPEVNDWLRGRDLDRYALSDEEWAERCRESGMYGDLDAILNELRTHSRQYTAFREAISGAPSKLPKAISERKRDLKREMSRRYNRRFITLVNAGNTLIADTLESPALEHEVARWASAAAHEQQPSLLETGATGR